MRSPQVPRTRLLLAVAVTPGHGLVVHGQRYRPRNLAERLADYVLPRRRQRRRLERHMLGPDELLAHPRRTIHFLIGSPADAYVYVSKLLASTAFTSNPAAAASARDHRCEYASKNLAGSGAPIVCF